MRVGIISDTHGSLPTAIHSIFIGVDHIIHAGDIGGQHILDELEIIAPVIAVYGNCDYSEDYLSAQETVSIVLGKTRFFIAHRPLQVAEALRGRGGLSVGSPLPHVCVHGHTHIPRNEYAGAALMLCPGSPVRPRGGSDPSVLILQLDFGKAPSAEFHSL